MKWIALIFVLVALVIIAGTGWIYFNALGKPFTAITIDDWTSFGTYFGGTAGPLLAFLTVAGLVLTLLMQNHQLEQVAQGDLKDKHVRMLIEIGRDLEAMEAQHLTSDVTLGDVLNGASSLPSSGEQVFRTTLQSYVKVLGYFAQSVELYRDNISPYFDCRAFEQRGLRLLARVEPYVQYLGQMGGPGLVIMRAHLENTLVKRP
ncbi:hypothetical protein QAA18_02510 [Luteimonas sp. 8-5]|uniref:hypothetical protein n=1 Tax=Luteimonas sp. 8-5 TaxID=3039387 RepID=UPI0024368C6C|nr:hypothetical protein [Luteimonas sp. 8-5]MDG6347621.1 hypothetical protein [Luteimonas sp. 8-5]